MHFGFLFMLFVMGGLLALPHLAWAANPQPQLLYVTQDNCKLIRGYSRNDLAGVAKEFGVPIDKVSFVKAQWSKGPEGRPQCNMVFDTPKGRTACAVFNIENRLHLWPSSPGQRQSRDLHAAVELK